MLGLLKKNSAGANEAESKNWYRDRYQHVLVWRNILIIITLLSLVTALVSAIAYMQLAPLKSIEPFVIEIDQNTGETQTVNPVKAKEWTARKEVLTHFVVQYIRARESYDVYNYKYNYDSVRLMSSNSVYRDFVANYLSGEKTNFKRLGVDGIRTIKFRSISFINNESAQVRLLIEERNKNNTIKYDKIVFISFEFAQLEMTPEQQFTNPLGFRVKNYVMNEDIVQ